MNLFRSIASAFAFLLIVGGVLARAANDARESSQLSETERLRWQLAATRSQLHAALAERDACRMQIVPARGLEVKAELAKLKAAIEAAHDGWTFSIETGQLTKKPEQKNEPKP